MYTPLMSLHFFISHVQMREHDFKLSKVPFFPRNLVDINVSRSAAPKLANVPANRHGSDIK